MSRSSRSSLRGAAGASSRAKAKPALRATYEATHEAAEGAAQVADHLARRAAAKVLTFATNADNSELANVTGPLDANLRQLETELDVAIRRRGHQFRITGDAARAQQAIAVLEHFLARAQRPISVEDIQLYFVEMRGSARVPSTTPSAETAPGLHTRRR